MSSLTVAGAIPAVLCSNCNWSAPADQACSGFDCPHCGGSTFDGWDFPATPSGPSGPAPSPGPAVQGTAYCPYSMPEDGHY
jgi:hypothetical protein